MLERLPAAISGTVVRRRGAGRRVAGPADLAPGGPLVHCSPACAGAPHSLRHWAITGALDAGVSLRDVQDFAGHADPRTTRCYCRGAACWLLVDLDELVEHWTLLDDDLQLVAGNRGATRLGFALLLKFYTPHGRLPAGRDSFADDVVEFVASQVQVSAAELESYGWSDRAPRYHQQQIRQHLGFRECSVEDADKLTAWLATHVCGAERQCDVVQSELLNRCRAERIEPPTAKRAERIVRWALHAPRRR